MLGTFHPACPHAVAGRPIFLLDAKQSKSWHSHKCTLSLRDHNVNQAWSRQGKQKFGYESKQTKLEHVCLHVMPGYVLYRTSARNQ